MILSLACHLQLGVKASLPLLCPLRTLSEATRNQRLLDPEPCLKRLPQGRRDLVRLHSRQGFIRGFWASRRGAAPAAPLRSGVGFGSPLARPRQPPITAAAALAAYTRASQRRQIIKAAADTAPGGSGGGDARRSLQRFCARPLHAGALLRASGLGHGCAPRGCAARPAAPASAAAAAAGDTAAGNDGSVGGSALTLQQSVLAALGHPWAVAPGECTPQRLRDLRRGKPLRYDWALRPTITFSQAWRRGL